MELTSSLTNSSYYLVPPPEAILNPGLASELLKGIAAYSTWPIHLVNCSLLPPDPCSE